MIMIIITKIMIFDDDDDNDTEMMIRALRVSWVNCGKVGGL